MTSQKFSSATCLLLVFTWWSPPPAVAATVEGMRFAERVQPDPAIELRLCSAELLRYKRIFRGYVAALYLEDCGLRAKPLADVPRRLELAYFWAIPGSAFGPAAEEVLERNLDADQLARIREPLRRFHAAFRDVEPGDRYALAYLPGRGIELLLNDTRLVLETDTEFARAYFGIWLGADPLDSGLRDRLLRAPSLTPPLDSAAGNG